MPATLDFSQPRLSDYSYGPVDQESESTSDPRFFSSWHNIQAASGRSQLPRLFHDTYESSSEGLQNPVEQSMAERGEKPTLSWTAGDLHDSATPTYLSNAQNSCHHAGLHSIENSNNQWNMQNYSFGYPTPQSDLSLSPMQQAHEGFPAMSLHENTRQRGIYAASELADAHDELDGLSTDSRQFSHRLKLQSPEEPHLPYRLDENDRRPTDPIVEDDEDGSINCEPYAQLIFKALKSAPGHRMVLKDIYQWFEKHTNKAKGGSKGWQNSIRHNLSMNGGFKKVDQDLPTDDAKRGFIWVLEPSALADGVKSTTRYRKFGSNKKVAKPGHAAPERQRSGAKGGKAARNAAKTRRSTRNDGPRSWNPEDIPLQSVEAPLSNIADQPLTPTSIWTPDGMESLFDSASRSLTPISTGQSIYSYGDIAGVTSVIPHGPLFAEECEGLGSRILACKNARKERIRLRDKLPIYDIYGSYNPSLAGIWRDENQALAPTTRYTFNPGPAYIQECKSKMRA
ncbi:MAG: hypothetical protein Q9166_003121 [cf. Caloplaca sp. 2 TL-2023]